MSSAYAQPSTARTYRELAEQVLFGSTLAEKLAVPQLRLTDDQKGTAITTPDTPGRPPELVPYAVGDRTARPKAYLLEDNEDRSALLHQFANHELLAAELMALALLKFPDAPEAFRNGLVRTLQEEQDHTRLYLRRLDQLGVPFGSLPVNGFFLALRGGHAHAAGLRGPPQSYL